MEGYLIVNSFLKKEKFTDIYTLLTRAAERVGVELKLYSGSRLMLPVGDELSEKPDFAIFWDKDISLGRRLEEMGIPLFNSARAVELCDSKILTAEALTKAGVAHPRTVVAPMTFDGVGYNDRGFLERAADILGFPMVVKEAFGSFGAQVYLCHDMRELVSTVEKIGSKPFLMQEFISESRGRDLRINVVGGRVVSAMMRQNEGDFRSNISGGGHTVRYEISDAQADIAIRAAEALGLDFAGVDVMFGCDGPIVCEVNSNPHFRSSLECTGVDMSDYIIGHILGKL